MHDARTRGPEEGSSRGGSEERLQIVLPKKELRRLVKQLIAIRGRSPIPDLREHLENVAVAAGCAGWSSDEARELYWRQVADQSPPELLGELTVEVSEKNVFVRKGQNVLSVAPRRWFHEASLPDRSSPSVEVHINGRPPQKIVLDDFYYVDGARW